MRIPKLFYWASKMLSFGLGFMIARDSDAPPWPWLIFYASLIGAITYVMPRATGGSR